jgi:hypothetical protein
MQSIRWRLDLLRVALAGYYRWSINAFSYLRNVTAPHKKWVPVFDEPFISMDWARDLAPHRVGLVGESLFVHCQVSGRDKCVRL